MPSTAVSLLSLTLLLNLPLMAADFPRDPASLRPGETLTLPAGRFEQPLVLEGLKGTQDEPIRIVGEPGAVLDGTRRLTARWEPWRQGVWKTTLDFDVWQLFIEDQLVYLARWPNASFEDGSLWRMERCMRNTDHGWDYKQKQPTGRTKPGVIYDADFEQSTSREFREGDASHGLAGRRTQSLAECGEDFTGALVVLNAGHWMTWTRRVTQHGAGADHFTYDETPPTRAGSDQIIMRRNVVYYMLGLQAVDRPNEWWFDATTKTVYLWPPDGRDPNTLPIRGKVRDHGIVLKNCADIEFKGLHVFGQGFKLDGCQRVRFEDCRFDYPATHRFPLGDLALLMPGRPGYASYVSRLGNEDVAFVNCEFAYSNAPLYLLGKRTLLENCDVHDIEWDLNSSGGCGTIVTGEDSTVRRCTVCRAGNSEGIRPAAGGNTLLLNHLWDMGNLQHDGAALNVGTKVQSGALVAQNWAHDCNRQSVRFDYHDRNGEVILRDDGEIYGDGVYLRNVSWNTQPAQVKGDRHLVLNNTVVNCTKFPDPATELMNMGVMGFKVMHGLNFNEHSVTRNNLANLAHRSWAPTATKMRGFYELPGIVDHNLRERGAAFKYLRDPVNYDFRPKAASPLVDAGAEVRPEEVKSPVARFERLAFVGAAPDIGAYEFGNKRYWIPGCQRPLASTPIPRHGADHVPLDADLMFLEAYRCTRHRVWFGEAGTELRLLAELKDASTNILTPPRLKPNTRYAWRVDAVLGQQVKKGERWVFTTR